MYKRKRRRHLGKRFDGRLRWWSSQQARWCGASFPNQEQMDSTSSIQERRRIMQDMWNYCSRNGNYICTIFMYDTSCSRSKDDQFVLFLIRLTWQYYTDRGNRPNLKLTEKIRGTVKNKVGEKQSPSTEALGEAIK